jgi:hypothetical protein
MALPVAQLNTSSTRHEGRGRAQEDVRLARGCDLAINVSAGERQAAVACLKVGLLLEILST